MKRILLTMAAAFGLAGAFDAFGAVWDGIADTSWHDSATETAAYEISTAKQLAGLAKLVNEGTSFAGKTVTLTADIDLGNASWTPIGVGSKGTSLTAPTSPFRGTFDGAGHTVSNLKVDCSSTGYVGLFGQVGAGATLKNLSIRNADVLGGDSYAGALAGDAYKAKAIESCSVAGTVSVRTDDAYGLNIGGLLGRAFQVETSTGRTGGGAGGTVAGAGNQSIGGLLGLASKVTEIEGCAVKGGEINVSGQVSVGGLIGNTISFEGFPLTLSDCSVEGGNIHVSSTQTPSEAPTSAVKVYAGGLVGLASFSGTGTSKNQTFRDCSVKGAQVAVSGSATWEGADFSACVGGLVGDSPSAILETCEVRATATVSASAAQNVGGLAGRAYCGIAGCTVAGDTIDLTSTDWCVGGIVGLSVTSGYVRGCTVEGILDVKGQCYVGGIIGNNYYTGEVSGNKVAGKEGSFLSVSSEDYSPYVGGIVGFGAEGSNIAYTDCAVSGVEISAPSHVGGIAGIVHYGNTIQNCTVENVKVTATNAEPRVGLIAGVNQGTVGQSPSKVLDCTVVDSAATAGGQPVTRQVGTANNAGALVPAGCTIVGRDVVFDASGKKVLSDTFETLDASLLAEGATLAVAPDGTLVAFVPVATVGETPYATLAEAVAAAPEGTTVTLLADAEGDGLLIGRSLTLDLGGHTYAVSGALVGSAGTESQCVHVSKGAGNDFASINSVTIKNGTIVAKTGTTPMAVGMIVQNYANLTLTDVTLDCGEVTTVQYGLSSNCGNVSLTGATAITVPEGRTALDCSWWPSAYPAGTKVTVDTTGRITGNIEMGFYGSNGTIREPAESVLDILNVDHKGTITVVSPTSGAYGTGWDEAKAQEMTRENLNLHGGSYSQSFDPAYCVSGRLPTLHEDGTYGVSEESYVAAITRADGSYVGYASLSAAVADVPTDGTGPTAIALLADTEGGGIVVTAGQRIALDLGGHTYTVVAPTVGSPGTETNGFQLLKGAEVAIRNGAVEASASSAAILFQNYCDLTLENVRVNAGRRPGLGYAVSNNFGSLTVKGDTEIVASEGGVAFDLWYGMSQTYADGVSVTFDESFTGKVVGKVEYGAGAYGTEGWQKKAPLTIAAPNGTFDVTLAASSDDALAAANVVISGGVFATAPALGHCATGYAPIAQMDGTFAVSGPYLALVNKTGCKTLPGVLQAIAAQMQAGTTDFRVTLLDNVFTDTGLIIPDNVTMTLDLNGKTYHYEPTGKKPNDYAIFVGNTVNEKFVFEDTSFAQTGRLETAGTAVCCVSNQNGRLEVLGGRFAQGGSQGAYAIISTADVKISPAPEQSVRLEGGLLLRKDGSRDATALIEGGEFVGTTYYALYLGEYMSGSVKANVTGGTFTAEQLGIAVYMAKPSELALKGGTYEGALYVAEEAKETPPTISGGTYSEKPDSAWCANGYGAFPESEGGFVIHGGTECVILNADGIWRADVDWASLGDDTVGIKDNETVVALTDVTLSETLSLPGRQNVTLDLNGKTLTAPANDFALKLAVDGSYVIKNGCLKGDYRGVYMTTGSVTLEALEVACAQYVLWVAGGAMTIGDGCKVTSSATALYCNNAPTVTIEQGAELTNTGTGYATVLLWGPSGATPEVAGPTLKVFGKVTQAATGNVPAAITGNGTDKATSTIVIGEGAEIRSEDSCALYLPNPCDVSVTGGTIEGQTGIGMKSGKLTLSGNAVVKGTFAGEYREPTSSGSGIADDGSAILIDSHTGYAGAMEVSVGGNVCLESVSGYALREIGQAEDVTNLFSLTVTGGTFLGAEAQEALKVRPVSAETVALSGGAYSSRPSSVYCAEGFVPKPNGDGSYAVAKGTYVAQIGDERYATLEEAMEGSEAEAATVRLLDRTAATEAVTATSKGVTLKGGEAYDVAELLGGAFAVGEDRATLSYAYDLGVGGLSVVPGEGGALTLRVLVALNEHGAPATDRTLGEGRRVVVTVANGATEKTYVAEAPAFGEGVCAVEVPYADLGMGTSKITVRVTTDAKPL